MEDTFIPINLESELSIPTVVLADIFTVSQQYYVSMWSMCNFISQLPLV